jgi:hypothetical protein
MEENKNRKSKSVNIDEKIKEKQAMLEISRELLKRLERFKFGLVNFTLIGETIDMDTICMDTICSIIKIAFNRKEIEEKLLLAVVKEEVTLLETQNDLENQIKALCARKKHEHN